MAVRFKFRSSVDFDTVDIGGRPSISVRDLKVKIVEQKNLKICQDSDLVISDAVTGQAYEDEDYPVPDGSSVIIKRVPAGGSAPSVLPSIDSIKDRVAKHTGFIATVASSPSANEDMADFDDFGVDLYPVPEGSLSDSEPDVGKLNCINREKAENVARRSSEPSISRCQNFELSDLSEAIPRGILHKKSVRGFDAEEDAMQANLKSKTEEHKKLDEELDTSSPTVPNTDLPSELKCSLCNSIFKEAVMIPCCQHSFCDKCIRLVLLEKARCPKCSSTKFKVEDLLPNVSLRQAIEHFLESQVLISGSDNIIPRYAPDGESGIQMKEVSCAMSVIQREPLLPHSPSATGKGSNLVMTDPANELLIRKNKVHPGTGSRIIRLDSNKSANSAVHKTKQTKNGDEKGADACPAYFKGTPECLKDMVDFQGDSEPFKLPQTLRQKEEANSASKKSKGLWVNTADGTGNFMAASRHKKGDRTCYMCGSPDHFVRDCPAASSPYPMLQTGDAMFPGSIPPYGTSYWHGAPLPHVRPYANLYGTPGVMPFDPSMVPVTPFGIPPYMSSMYASMPVPCGFMMGGLAPPMVAGAERPLSREEFMEFQDSGRKRKVLNEHPQREYSLHGDGLEEGYHYSEPHRRSHDRKPHLNREGTRSYSEDNDNLKSQKKHQHDKHSDSLLRRQRLGVASDDEDIRSVDRKNEKGSHFSFSGRDQKSYHSEKSNSGIQDVSDSSERHSRERLKHHRRSCSKKHSERRGQCTSNSSRKTHHRSRRETSDDRKKVEPDVKKHSHKRHTHSETLLEPSYSDDRKRQRREKEHPRHKAKATDDQLKHGRWEMVNGLDHDYGDDYHYHKRKRIH